MVKLMGHVAMGLLFALPAWYRWEGRLPLAFVGFVLTTVVLPDVDLVLSGVVPGVHHHGVNPHYRLRHCSRAGPRSASGSGPDARSPPPLVPRP